MPQRSPRGGAGRGVGVYKSSRLHQIQVFIRAAWFETALGNQRHDVGASQSQHLQAFLLTLRTRRISCFLQLEPYDNQTTHTIP